MVRKPDDAVLRHGTIGGGEVTATSPTTFRAFLREPFDLALGQPHQMLISSASVAIVAVEAASIVPWPFNIALAVGAEWAYLRGLISGAGVKTPWAARLNWAAFLLVVLYGGLAGLRGFHLIPGAPPPAAAVLLTIIHIGAISAVTLCSAMLHRAGEDAKATALQLAQDRETKRAADEQQYQDDLKRQRDLQQMDLARKQAELALYEHAEQAKAVRQLELEKQRAELRASVRASRTPTASGTAANSLANTTREQLRRTVVERLREQPDANRSALARSLGIGRTTLYDLIGEAERAGELPGSKES